MVSVALFDLNLVISQRSASEEQERVGHPDYYSGRVSAFYLLILATSVWKNVSAETFFLYFDVLLVALCISIVATL